MSAFTTSRISTVRLSPPRLAGGINGSTSYGVVVDRQTLAGWMGSAAWMAKGRY